MISFSSQSKLSWKFLAASANPPQSFAWRAIERALLFMTARAPASGGSIGCVRITQLGTLAGVSDRMRTLCATSRHWRQ